MPITPACDVEEENTLLTLPFVGLSDSTQWTVRDMYRQRDSADCINQAALLSFKDYDGNIILLRLVPGISPDRGAPAICYAGSR